MPVLVVQMGHAGRTKGATGAPGEQAFTKTVGAVCAALLNRGGWQVRVIAADPPSAFYRGDAFVAVHADGNDDPAVSGGSVGYRNDAGKGLAHAWRDAYVRRGGPRVWHPDNYTTNLSRYYGTGTAVAQGNARACIIECGTITNPADRALMTGPGGPERVALAIGEALGIVPPAPITDEEDVMAGLTEADGKALIWRLAGLLAGNETVDTGHWGQAGSEPIEPNIKLNRLEKDVAELKELVQQLVGQGIVLRPSGQITVKAEGNNP